MSARVCPRCGSARTKRAPELTKEEKFYIVQPRICRDCWAEYSPMPARWQGVVWVALGLLGIATGLLTSYYLFFFRERIGPPLVLLMACLFTFGGGGMGVYYGALVILGKPIVRDASPEQRSRALAAFDANPKDNVLPTGDGRIRTSNDTIHEEPPPRPS